jgi:hypothetical protein
MYLGKIITVKEQNPIHCNSGLLVRSDRPPEPYQNTAIACSHSKSDLDTQGKGLIEGCDRCSDRGGKAISQPRLIITNPTVRTFRITESSSFGCIVFLLIAARTTSYIASQNRYD